MAGAVLPAVGAHADVGVAVIAPQGAAVNDLLQRAIAADLVRAQVGDREAGERGRRDRRGGRNRDDKRP